MKIDLDEAIVLLRELLAMNKRELAQCELKYTPDLNVEKVTRAAIVLFAFERAFDPKTTVPAKNRRDSSNGMYRDRPSARTAALLKQKTQ